MIASIELYEKGFDTEELKNAMNRSQTLPSKNSENCTWIILLIHRVIKWQNYITNKITFLFHFLLAIIETICLKFSLSSNKEFIQYVSIIDSRRTIKTINALNIDPPKFIFMLHRIKSLITLSLKNLHYTLVSFASRINNAISSK